MSEREQEYIKNTVSKIENEVVKNRIEYLLRWYSKKATLCKHLNFLFVSFSIIAPASITMINSCYPETTFWGINKINLISWISTLATVVAGILAITRWQESWLRYRKTVELIKSRISSYLILREFASDKNARIVYDLYFINAIEEITQEENSEWLSMIRKEQDNSNK